MAKSTIRSSAFLLPLSLTMIAFLVLYHREHPAVPRKNSITFHDCSNPDSEMPSEHSPFWTETSGYMEANERAKNGVRLLLRHNPNPKGLIIDMGAGFQALRRHIPNGTFYEPVDFVQRVEGVPTSICNLNNKQFPFFHDQQIAAYFFLGSFEYVLDKINVLRMYRMRGAPVIMQYNVGMTAFSKRFEWVAPFSLTSFLETARLLDYQLSAYEVPGMKPISRGNNRLGLTLLYFKPVSATSERN